MAAHRTDFQHFVKLVDDARKGVKSAGGGAWTGLGGDQYRPVVIQGKVLDQSLGGYRVMWKNADSVKAKVGELIGLSTGGDEDEQVWMAGVLRWLRVHPNDQIEVGIELLSRKVLPLTAQARQGRFAAAQRGVMLWPLRPGQGERSVVLPAFASESEPELTISHFDDAKHFDPRVHSKQLSLKDCLENTGQYAQFTYAEGGGVKGGARPASDEPAWNLL
jgi:cyclic-di-GMP-binding protein